MRLPARLRSLLALAALLLVSAASAAGEAPMGRPRAIAITTLFDNLPADARLATGWGFAVLVETGDGAVLFDTGADSKALLANMRRLGIEPKAIGAVVISHRHSDHLGGLAGFLAQNGKTTVYITDSFPESVHRTIRAAGARSRDVSGQEEILPGVWVTGPVLGEPDEQALVVDTAHGLAILTGCAHPGIVRMVEAARAQHRGRPIALVMGGFHLRHTRKAEIAKIVQAFRRLGVAQVAPSHCTGEVARSLFRKEYGADFVEGGVGKVLGFRAE